MDLNAKLEKLRQTVTEGTIRKNEEAERARQIARAEKARDWNHILETQPEAAEFINQMGAEFGKLDRVLIWNEKKELILDSRKYDSIHDPAKRRR